MHIMFSGFSVTYTIMLPDAAGSRSPSGSLSLSPSGWLCSAA